MADELQKHLRGTDRSTVESSLVEAELGFNEGTEKEGVYRLSDGLDYLHFPSEEKLAVNGSPAVSGAALIGVGNNPVWTVLNGGTDLQSMMTQIDQALEQSETPSGVLLRDGSTTLTADWNVGSFVTTFNGQVVCDLGTTPTNAILLDMDTAVGQDRDSHSIILRAATGFSPSGTTHDYKIYVGDIDSGEGTFSRLKIDFSDNGGAYTNAFALTPDGTLAISILNTTGNVSVGDVLETSGAHRLSGYFLMDGTISNVNNYGMRIAPDVTGINGTEKVLSQADIGFGNGGLYGGGSGGSVTTKGGGTPIAYDHIQTLHLKEPNITVAGSDTLADAHTLLIEDAPTEGVNNWALRVISGATKLGGTLDVTGLLGADGGVSIENGQPTIALHDTGSGVDEKRWEFIVSGDLAAFRTRTDAGGLGEDLFFAQRSGTNVDRFILGSSEVVVNNKLSVGVVGSTNKFRVNGDARVDDVLYVDQIDTVPGTAINGIQFNDNLFLTSVKSGATQGGAGAAAGEVWKTASHASLPDNVLMIGV